jgi:hypothetical protein
MDQRKIQFFFSVIEHGNLSSAAQSHCASRNRR